MANEFYIVVVDDERGEYSIHGIVNDGRAANAIKEKSLHYEPVRRQHQ